jgi:hypothetical protein
MYTGMNTRQKGDYSEVVVLAELLRREMRVAIPYGNSQGYDAIVFGKNGWKSIQIKTAYRRGKRGNRIYIDTIRGTSINKRRGYSKGSFDYLVAVLPDERLFWIIPFSKMEGRRCISLSETTESDWSFS